MLVALDCIVNTNDAFVDLCKALKVNTFDGPPLKLIINSIDAPGFGTPQIAILLDQLNADHLTGLNIAMNVIEVNGICELSPAIAKFVNLSE